MQQQAALLGSANLMAAVPQLAKPLAITNSEPQQQQQQEAAKSNMSESKSGANQPAAAGNSSGKNIPIFVFFQLNPHWKICVCVAEPASTQIVDAPHPRRAL